MSIEEEFAERIDKALDGDCGYGVGESLAAVLMPLVRKAQAEALREMAARVRADFASHGMTSGWVGALDDEARRIEQNSEGNET